MYPGGEAVRAGVESFGFPPHFHDTLHEFPICHVNALLAGTLNTAPAKEPEAGKGSIVTMHFFTLSLICPPFPPAFLNLVSFLIKLSNELERSMEGKMSLSLPITVSHASTAAIALCHKEA